MRPVSDPWPHDRSPEHQIWQTQPDNEGLPSATSTRADKNFRNRTWMMRMSNWN
jgi:hypothetical protein